MTASFFITCPDHPSLLVCADDQAYDVETAAAALVLHAAQHPEATGKIARVGITCEVGGCSRRITFPADSVTDARTIAAGHDFGWYRARRGKRLVDGCQFHLGSCCVGHVHPDSPTLDAKAVLADPTARPAPVQSSLFDLAGRAT